MSETTQIRCDGCGADLTYTGNSVDYRLVLASQAKPTRPDVDAVTDMMIYPAVDSPKHFCRIACLEQWLDNRVPHVEGAWFAEPDSGRIEAAQ